MSKNYDPFTGEYRCQYCKKWIDPYDEESDHDIDECEGRYEAAADLEHDRRKEDSLMEE